MLFLAYIAATATIAATRHEVLTFDYGWRFHLGDPSTPSPAPTPPPVPTTCGNVSKVFPVDASGFAWDGLGSHHAKDAEACAEACCQEKTCWTWQFSLEKNCWMGVPTGKRRDSSWKGGARNSTKPPGPPPVQPDTPADLPTNPAAAKVDYDDSKWRLLDLPHDYIVEQSYNKTVPSDQGHGRPSGGAGQSYLPRDVAYYRKHFNLPANWGNNTVWVHFEGVFRITKIWLNGVPIREHAAFKGDARGEAGGAGMGGGYTSFNSRLDNCSAVQFGGHNVLTVYVDPRMGSGWFYEGGGIYRKTYLHSAPQVHVETDGVYAFSQVAEDDIITRMHPALGSRASSARVEVSAEIVNTKDSAASAVVEFELFDAAGKLVGDASPKQPISIPAASASSPATASSGTLSINVAAAELWSVARPYLYTLRVSLDSGDVRNTSIGIYSTKWTGDQGFFMNGQHVKIRGFCNHESFGGVGMAIPDRVNLFRAQALRSVGGNGWRMSHNPVTPGLYDILDRVGVVAMDENRILGTDAISVMNMGAMVKRDRNHPSIVIWSYCNEGGCVGSGEKFRNITLRYDTSRPTLGNRENFDSDKSTDVEGFSHKHGDIFDAYNTKYPKRPKFASECCSCSSQRHDHNGDALKTWNDTVEGLSCTANQSNASNGRPFMSGTMVWTLFDYYGESHGWPSVSSSYGQIDLAGFFKTTGYWYRTWWLSDVPTSDAGRPVGFGAAHSCHIVTSGQLNILTEAPEVHLYINGNLSEKATTSPLQNVAFHSQIPAYDSNNVTVACVGKDGHPTVLPKQVLKGSSASKIVLSLDAPNPQMGTGSSLVLDGHDVAMIRASIVDANGVVVDVNSNVSFEIVSGPGRILATHNGDNKCHEPNHAPWHSAFFGLVRALIQVTEHRIGSETERKLLSSIDLDVAHVTVPTTGTVAPAIVVKASSPGLMSTTLHVPVSIDDKVHGVLPTAQHSFQTEQHWS